MGDPANTKSKHKPISSSTSLAFTSNLSSLIASSKTKSSEQQPASKVNKRVPSPAPKASLFTAHREAKESKKRTRDDEQEHKTSRDVGRTDESDLARSKRKMLEKTRLYNAMKRGEYIGRDDYDERGLVDFDKKWADTQGKASQSDDVDSDSDDGGSESESGRAKAEEDKAQWTDEFGRLRTGTAQEKRRFERSQRIASAAEAAFEDAKARPAAPENIIFGDTVQTHAFNPDTVIQERMAELAAKRDKEATPPPDSHYDGKAEVRTKGTGFFAFSKDEEARKKEMEALEQERAETERKRKERDGVKEGRKREIEARRKAIQERRSRKEADVFLDGLEIPDVGGGLGDDRDPVDDGERSAATGS